MTFTGESEDLKKMNYITWLLIIPTLFISRIYFSVYCSRYVLNHQFLQGVKLKVNYTIWQYIRFHLANFFLVFLSLGLASPYVAFRNLMFFQKYWDLEGDPDDLLAEQSSDETTGQDGASALFDISDF